MMFTGVHLMQPRFIDRVPAEGEQCIVRTAYRQAKADGQPPAWRIVRWRGDTMQFRTPFEVEVPLLEKRQIELTLPGHTPFRGEINLLDLDSPRPVFTLEAGSEERE